MAADAMAPASPPETVEIPEEVPGAEPTLETPTATDMDKIASDLLRSRSDLLERVQVLKKDLQKWRRKLDTQVHDYRKELGELRSTLNTEVEQLKNEFQSLRNSLKAQMDATDELGQMLPELPEKTVEPTEAAEVELTDQSII